MLGVDFVVDVLEDLEVRVNLFCGSVVVVPGHFSDDESPAALLPRWASVYFLG